MNTPKPLGPAELNSGDLAGRVTALESVVHSWVEVCCQLREQPKQEPPGIRAAFEGITELWQFVRRLDLSLAKLKRDQSRDRLRRIKRHRYPKPKGN